MLTVCDEEEDGKGSGYMSVKEEEQHLDVVEVSLNSVISLTSTHMMKLRGKIGM